MVGVFTKQPVTNLVWGDAEERSVKRIASTVALNRADVVEPLTKLVKESLNMPLLMHKCPRACLTRLAGLSLELVDVIGLVKEELIAHLPFQWIAFAADFSDVLAAKQHFIEETHQ